MGAPTEAAQLEDNLFEDLDHELLYDRERDGFERDHTSPSSAGHGPDEPLGAQLSPE